MLKLNANVKEVNIEMINHLNVIHSNIFIKKLRIKIYEKIDKFCWFKY